MNFNILFSLYYHLTHAYRVSINFKFCILYRYSGVHSELGSTIDDAANIMWDNVSISINHLNIYLHC